MVVMLTETAAMKIFFSLLIKVKVYEDAPIMRPIVFWGPLLKNSKVCEVCNFTILVTNFSCATLANKVSTNSSGDFYEGQIC